MKEESLCFDECVKVSLVKNNSITEVYQLNLGDILL